MDLTDIRKTGITPCILSDHNAIKPDNITNKTTENTE